MNRLNVSDPSPAQAGRRTSNRSQPRRSRAPNFDGEETPFGVADEADELDEYEAWFSDNTVRTSLKRIARREIEVYLDQRRWERDLDGYWDDDDERPRKRPRRRRHRLDDDA